MIIYIENQAKNYPQTKIIIEKFSNSNIIYIDNYKNLFDKNISNKIENCFIVAKLNSPATTESPVGYGHNNKTSYFFKTSLNCIFDCSYCFLKGAFKNDIPVYFINYDDIKKQIIDKIKEVTNNNSPIIPFYKGDENSVEEKSNDYELKLKQNFSYKNKIWFYSSDYSDILGMDNISGFIKEFVPFFENIGQTQSTASKKLCRGESCVNPYKIAMMEVRTKSSNIKSILDLGFVPKNTEFAFSLNPQDLTDKYEKGTSSLESKIKSINILLDLGYKVGLRFLPLLPVKNYKEIYIKFVEEIKEKIEIKKISSTFVSGLLYTKSDYNNMLKKYPKLDILYRLQEEKSGFIRESREMRDFFYKIFSELDEKCFICLDEK